MYDLLTAIALICVMAGLPMVRIVSFASRVWTGLAFAAGAYVAAMTGMFLIRIGLDSQLLRYAWAACFAVPAIAATIFLVPSAQDWLRARWRHRHVQGAPVR
jgi:hypothetical protein